MRGGGGRGWEEREESRYPASMYPNDAFELNLSKTCLITALSILPSLFLSLSPRSKVFPLLPSPPQLLFVHPPQPHPPPTPPKPPAAANDLQEVRLAWQRAGSRSLLQERGMHGHRRCSRDGGVRLFALLLSVGPHLLDFSACFPFTLAMWHHRFCSVHAGKGVSSTVKQNDFYLSF